MPSLTAIPGLSPEAIEQLTSCGIESAEMLAGLSPAEIHRVLELTAWQKGKLNRAPTLDMVHHWSRLAQEVVGEVSVDDIPEAIVIPRPAAPAPQGGGYLPPSQRARLQTSGPATPAAPYAPPGEEVKDAVMLPAATRLPTAPVPRAAAVPATGRTEPVGGFGTFDEYQSGKTRATPLSRYSIDAPMEEREAFVPEPPSSGDDLPRTMRRGVVHPNPASLVFGAIVSLLWRVALLAGIVAVPWLTLVVPQPSQYKVEILTGLGLLVVLGLMQLFYLVKMRCRICTCHLFYSRNTVHNRKAHLIPGLGYVASLSLHILRFQWFRCMYCGTAIKLWSTRAEREDQGG